MIEAGAESNFPEEKQNRRWLRRRWRLILLAVIALAAIYPFRQWRDASNHGGQRYAEPFRIAGNLYYVGANDVTSFLITSPQGHVLIDGGYPGTPPMIMASIKQLGFDIKDVKILLNTHAHIDHAGGLAELQKASGAQLWVSDREAPMVASGGDSPELGVFRLAVWSGLAKFPAPRIDDTFKDGDTIRLGPIEMTAHVTPGHTPGCTSWSFPVQEGNRKLLVVEECSLDPAEIPFKSNKKARAQLDSSLRVLRSLPADIWVGTHAREFGRYRKFLARSTAKDSAYPFIDPVGYRAFLDRAEAKAKIRLGERTK